jgi:asparagine synthase (glutamine-hydrolysing)
MNVSDQLRNKLKEATSREKADALLLSGGVDTSILAFVGRPTMAFTVALKNSGSSDLIYARKVSSLLGMEHKEVEFTTEDALNALPEVIKMLKTFDLALPNDLSIYFALKLASEGGVSSVMTGDGSDELFAGYSYMVRLPPEHLRRYITEVSQHWHFSAPDLGKGLGIEVKQPFLDRDFVRFAVAINPELKVKGTVGKYILRKSFEDLMPEELVWREKEPIEYGSGSTRLHHVIDNMVSDAEFQSAATNFRIKFINKEHFFYYRIYSDVVGQIPKAKAGERSCPCCGAAMGKWHCPVCGWATPLNLSVI